MNLNGGAQSELLQSFGDRFNQLELIGEGVSAKVYKAIDAKTGHPVAIKILNPNLDTDEISIERFKREVQITRHLGHPQIISIYELFQTGKSVAMVMEFIDGDSLKDYIRLYHPVPVENVVSILRQAIDVLSVCHSKNVIHRDLKPQNIMIDREGRITLLDFGIARMTTLSDLTKTGTSLGSPEYMAPELFATNTYDPRTDIYALGVILFELLAGRLPFQADSLAHLFQQHLKDEPPKITEFRKDIPEWLSDLVAKMLSKRPFERYQSVEEILFDLENQKVVSKDLPSATRKNCVKCQNLTPDVVPVCIHCGFGWTEKNARGNYQLIVPDKKAKPKLAKMLKESFGYKVPAAAKRQNRLMQNVSFALAETIKKFAQKRGIYLQMVDVSSRFHRLTNLGLAVLVGTTVPVALMLSFRPGAILFLIDPGRRISIQQFQHFDVSAYMPLLVSIVTISVGLGVWALARLFERFRAPIIRNPVKLMGEISERHAWLNALGGWFQEIKGDEIKESVCDVVEKHVVLSERCQELNEKDRDHLNYVLKSLLQFAKMISQLGEEMSKCDIIQLTQGFRGGSRPELKKEIEAYNQLEEHYSSLVNRFVYFQYLYNRILAQALVIHTPSLREEVKLLTDQMDSMKSEAELIRSAKEEVERAA